MKNGVMMVETVVKEVKIVMIVNLILQRTAQNAVIQRGMNMV